MLVANIYKMSIVVSPRHSHTLDSKDSLLHVPRPNRVARAFRVHAAAQFHDDRVHQRHRSAAHGELFDRAEALYVVDREPGRRSRDGKQWPLCGYRTGR